MGAVHPQEYSVNIILPDDNVLPVRFITVDDIKEKVKQKTNIPKEKQIFYHEGERDVLLSERDVLSSDEIPEFLSMKPHLFVEDADNSTEERNWTVDVYSYSNGALFKAIVSVPYPSYFTDLGLKKLVHKRLNTVPVDDLILYHEGDVLPEGKPVRTCKSWINRVTVVVKDTHIELTESDWSIVVCGDFDKSHITVSVPFPFLQTVDDLKKSIEINL